MNDIDIPSMSSEARFGIGGNLPPEPIDEIRKDVDELIANTTKWAKQYPVIDNEDVAAECNEALNQLDKHWQKCEALRKNEKKRHDDAATAVQAKWKPLQDRLRFCKAAIKPPHDAWLKLAQQQIDEERIARQRVAAEARRLADQLAEQAKADGPGSLPNLIAAKEAEDEATRAHQAVTAVPQRAQTRGTLGGRTRSLQERWLAHVVDWDKCYQHYRERGEVRDVLSRLANADARGGLRNPDLPGCWIFSEES